GLGLARGVVGVRTRAAIAGQAAPRGGLADVGGALEGVARHVAVAREHRAYRALQIAQRVLEAGDGPLSTALRVHVCHATDRGNAHEADERSDLHSWLL